MEGSNRGSKERRGERKRRKEKAEEETEMVTSKVYNYGSFEQTKSDVLKVALKELLKRASQQNININVKFDNRSISILT
ncbi:MAG: hypothetical protein KAQ92_07705 [Candidatus Aenigmarchaeota archaeon]|nr:hypothetical protein [Candidatus Aenigmarchaeota archaeon]